MTRTVSPTLRPMLLAVVVTLAACGSGGSSGGTFACGASLACTMGAQYCLHNAGGSGSYTCVNLPAGCTPQAACDGCLGAIANQTSCVAIASVVEVDVSM